MSIYTYTRAGFHSEHIHFSLQGFSSPFLSSSLPFTPASLPSFSSLSFPCVLLFQCSVSLLFGWPLHKPWAHSEALLTLTLGLPVTQLACGKFSLL